MTRIRKKAGAGRWALMLLAGWLTVTPLVAGEQAPDEAEKAAPGGNAKDGNAKRDAPGKNAAPKEAAEPKSPRALYEAGDYAAAEEALAPLLAKRHPDAEALEVAFLAAKAQGRLLTAQQRARDLLRLVEDPSASVLVAAARTAEAVGEERLALSRYLAYLDVAEKATPDLAHAGVYVLERGSYPAVLRRMVDAFGPNDKLWSVGYGAFRDLLQADEADEALKLAAFLMEHFPDPDRIRAVHHQLREGADKGMLGREPEARYLRPLDLMIRYRPSDQWPLDWMMGNADRHMDAPRKVEVLLTIQALFDAPLRWGLLHRLGNMRNLPEPAARLEAGKKYLSYRKAYREASDPTHYREYLRVLGESPQVFRIEGKELVSPDEGVAMVERLYETYKGREHEFEHELRQLTHHGFLGERRAEVLRAHLDVLPNWAVNDLLHLTKDAAEREALTAEALKGQDAKTRRDRLHYLIEWANRDGKKDQLLAAAREYMLAKPAAFDWGHIWRNVIESKLPSRKEKVDLLQAVYAAAGQTPQLAEMVEKRLAKDKEWSADEAFRAFKEAWDRKTPGSDPVLRAHVALYTLRVQQHNPDKKVLEAVKSLLDSVEGPVPASWSQTKTMRDVTLLDAYHRHWHHIWRNRDAVVAAAKLWAPRLQLGGAWEPMLRRLHEYRREKLLYEVGQRYVALVADGDHPGHGRAWYRLRHAEPPAKVETDLFAGQYHKMGGNALEWLRHQDSRLGAGEVLKRLDAVTARKDFGIPDDNQARQIIHHVYHRTNDKRHFGALVERAWAYLRERGGSDPQTEAYVFGAYMRGRETERAKAFLKDHLPRLAKRPFPVRLDALQHLLGQMPREDKETLEALHRGKLVVEQILPAIESAPASFRGVGPIRQELVEEINRLCGWDGNDAVRTTALQAAREAGTMLAGGARYEGHSGFQLFDLGRRLVRDALAREAPADAAVAVRMLVAELADNRERDRVYRERLVGLCDELAEGGANELAFLLADGALRNGNPDEHAGKVLAMAKARYARDLNLIGVAENHPAYPLHKAQHELMLEHEEEAWRLTRGKLDLLPKEWVNLDPAYCVWALEQMRRQRVLDAGLEFALTMLLQEERLEPETAARIYLVKGDIYRDMRNFEAARAEYVSLQSRRRYAQTESGERATYRLIELMLQTGNYAGAEQHIEPLLESGDLAVQAEGYFYLAEAAFAREEYAVCREYLMECFQRKADHPEGRMLEGKLRPHLPRMLDVTRVKVGRETDKTVVVPGHELVVQLQDRNLAVVKGNKAIPVLVRTTATGDEERIELHVSPGEKNVFSGSVATGLGEPQPGNFTLEVSGRDAIEYVIDPAFQKANNLDYGPKRMEVRSNARLSASAGEILTPEEEQQREMERQMLAMSEDEQSRRFAGRDGRTVRPGSPVYVQVTDADRDVSPEADTVRVSLETTSGDRLDEFVLTETGPHTGIFRGEVPTNVPFPRAEASDTEEGLSPISVINKTKNEPWRSLPDGKKPKWIEVDTMSSYAVASASVALQAPQEIRRARLLGALAEEDRIELAVFPQQDDVALGGATLRIAGDQAGHRAWQIRRHVQRLGGDRARIGTPAFDRKESTHGKRNSWISYRIRAAFHLPENRVLELRFLQKPSPHNWQHAYLSIDGEEVLGGRINGQTVKRSRPVSLSAGGHWLEILVRDHWQHGAVEVGYRREDGQFAPLPAEWFDPEAQPALAEFLRPKGAMERTETGFAATLDEPQRLRRLRWVFEDFAGNAVAVDGMTVTGADGKQIIPVETDFAMGKTNETLEISPGDHLQVRYADALRLGNAPPELGQTLNSSYYNGSILLANEEIYTEGDRRTIRYEAARRCRIGDQLSILVTDWDEDLTDERDRVDVVVETSAGERLELKALETHYWDQRDERWHRHAGAFMQILKIGKETKGHTIKVTPGDTIFVRYLDRQNTKPGIPFEREYSVAEAGLGEPRVTVYATRTRLVEDTSPEARARLDRMRARGRDVEGRKIWREQVLARHPHVEPNDKQKDIAPPIRESGDGALFVSINAPILFEIQYPRMALNSGSVYHVGAVAASELAAAKQEGREPRITETPLYLEDLGERAREKGYEPYLMRPMRLSEEDILRDGLFAGVLRLQMGSPGDEPDELVVLENLEFRPPAWRDRKGDANRVPTVVVNGADTVHLLVRDDAGETVETVKLRLLSDARLELMDDSFTVRKPAIHLGESFHLRLTDPDHDQSEGRDRVTVAVSAASGDRLDVELVETLPHSGVFTGHVRPAFFGEDRPKNASAAPAANAPGGPEAATGEAKASDATAEAEEATGDGNAAVEATPDAKPANAEAAGGETAPAGPDPDDDELEVRFGDEVIFAFRDDRTLGGDDALDVRVEGRIHQGFNGRQAGFTKRFTDPEMAVKTRFLTAEALFEMAKEHRNLGKTDVADEEIARGKRILEEALRDYPNTSLVSQGEFLLANLAQELQKYPEAIGRYRNVINTWPDSEFAPRSQFKMAQCLEKMENYEQATEEYVRLTYIYPDHPLVAEATARLGNYYYKAKNYDVAGKIFYQFQEKNPEHRLASRALFLAAQCEMKLRNFHEAILRFEKLIGTYEEESDVRAEAMYWMGDCYHNVHDYMNAYRTFKKLTWDYPETKWAKIARGRLTEEAYSRIED